jgi:Periplasmic component of the Tol biopolymer transport system
MKKNVLVTIILFLSAAGGASAQQEFNMRITEGMPAVAFALPPFVAAPAAKDAAAEIHSVLEADIRYTRIFELLPKSYYGYIRPLTDPNSPEFKDWESIQANVLLTGRVEAEPEGGIIFSWVLYDVKSKRTIIAPRRFQYKDKNLRYLAHATADEIMKAYGEKPIFTSKIAFVSNRDRNEEIYLMDYDGANQTRLIYNQVNDSNPAWDPGGKRLAYSSWQNLVVGVYILDVFEKARARTPVSLKGQNYTPAWSPDGKKLAFSSSMNGNHEIYVADIESNPTRVGRIKQLTFNPAVDIAPSWSPQRPGNRLHLGPQRNDPDLHHGRRGRQRPPDLLRSQPSRRPRLVAQRRQDRLCRPGGQRLRSLPVQHPVRADFQADRNLRPERISLLVPRRPPHPLHLQRQRPEPNPRDRRRRPQFPQADVHGGKQARRLVKLIRSS